MSDRLWPGTGESYFYSYSAGALPGWAVIFTAAFDGEVLSPDRHEAVWFSDAQSPNGTGHQALAFTPAPAHPDRVRVDVTWIEWHTGRAWTATLDDDAPREHTILFFAPGGEIRLYQRGAALREGSLGRAATFADFEVTARLCATPLPETDPRHAELESLRARNYGFAPDELPPLPDPLPDDCGA
ncbi:hypothetical protein FHY55_08610 [Oceanicola sp. D3]|uniref:hypothetical protein n=1 Tax=Oceanicola sp. D3 TaxID=2587163 RepID=UPI00111FD0DA|nr:hypothetical protein [Oceanicola sp. D3]QDC09298.1 hypothetical protein FHY55_08610 [Oceanicola sp. D3]